MAMRRRHSTFRLRRHSTYSRYGARPILEDTTTPENERDTMPESQSPAQQAQQQAMNAERVAAQRATIQRGKSFATAKKQADREARAAEVAKRNADDAAMNIPVKWSEPRKHAARQKYANAQTAASVAAEEAANPGKKGGAVTSHGHGYGYVPPAGGKDYACPAFGSRGR